MAPITSYNSQSTEILTINLSRALSRLEKKILSSSPNSPWRHSSYERAKTSANLEYARTLLLRLEQDASSIKIQSRKQAAQDDLIRQRALIKRLTDTLHDLDNKNQDDNDDKISSDQQPSSAEDEDLLGDDDVDTSSQSSTPSLPRHNRELPVPPPPIPTKSTLRNPKHHHQPSASDTPDPPSTSPSTTIAAAPILESDASTQAALTNSLLSLATALKTSSLAISESIALDAETLARATDGLDRNTTGMQVAGKRMGLLKRMTEGKGWWGRMLLYAWIGGLWVLALVIVFVLPKLRF